MTRSDNETNIPSDNPLAQEEFDDAMQQAGHFWNYYDLGDMVDEDTFRNGALIFHDLEGAREFEQSFEKHTEDQRSSYSERDKCLARLTDRQRTSIRLFTRRNRYRGDAVADVLFDNDKDSERKRLWDHLKTFSTAQWQIFFACCLAAMTQGWDQAAMNGANIAWPSKDQLNIDMTTGKGVFIFGSLNAAPFAVGAVMGSLITDPLINSGLGRRWAIALGGICSLIPVICTLFVNDWRGFLVCRILLGVGMGAKVSVVPIYISEIAPETIRGRMSMCWQLFDTFGILTGSVVNYIIYCYSQDQPSWRIMISISGVPALLLLASIVFCVESPRWLMKKNRYKEALLALISLHQLPSHIIACGQLYMIYRQLEAEESGYLQELKDKIVSKKGSPHATSTAVDTQAHNHGDTGVFRRQDRTYRGPSIPMDDITILRVQNGSSISKLQRESHDVADPSPELHYQDVESLSNSSDRIVKEPKLEDTSLRKRIQLLWHVDHIRRAFRASQFVMAAQQACGINILAFMSNIIFAKAMTGNGSLTDLSNKQMESSLKFSIYFGITNHFSTYIPLLFIDKGRRTLLKFTFPFMAISLFLSGLGLFLRETKREIGDNIFYAFTMIFTFFFSIGEGPAAFVISSEVFPLMVRELGMSLAVFTNFFLAAVLSFCIPLGLTRAANTGGFWMGFGGVNLILWVLSLMFVYETKGEKLEGINRKYNKSWKEGSWLGKRISELGRKLRKTQ